MSAKSINWPGAAERLHKALLAQGTPVRWPDALPGMKADSPVGISCSGGLDSTVVLLTIWAGHYWPRDQLCVLHFNHRMRGEAADQDEAFVRQLAESLGLCCLVGHRAMQRRQAVSEAALREDRFQFFRETGIRHIVTGHHFQDVLETFLMRMSRGSALEGLLRPEWISRHGDFTFLRPLIEFPRDSLLIAAREAGITWREDCSNAENEYLRNRIRNQLIPVWKALFPDGKWPGLHRTMELLREDEAGWRQLLDEIQPEGETKLQLKLWKRWPRSLRRRALWRWLKAVDAADVFSAEGFETWLTELEQGRATRTSLGRNRWSVVKNGCLQVDGEAHLPQWRPQSLHPGIWLYLPNGASLFVERVPVNDSLRQRLESGAVDSRRECYIAESGCELQVRLRRPGDRYHLMGAQGGKKLKDILIDRKIDRRERDQIPLVCMGTDPVWYPGLPPAESSRIRKETEWALRLTYRPHC